MNPDLSKAQGPGRIAMFIFGGIAALQLLLRAVFMAGAGAGIGRFYMTGRGLLVFVGVIFYLVWLHRVHAAMKGQTKFTPGMAVGSWFIPVYNFVAPFLSLNDLWRRLMGGQSPWVPAVWWSTYLASVVLNGVMGVPAIAVHIPAVLSWVIFAVNLVSMATWAFALQQLMARPNAPAPVTA